LIRKAPKWRVLTLQLSSIIFYAAVLTVGLNTLILNEFAYGYLLLVLIFGSYFLFVFYLNTRGLFQADYELNDLGIKTGQFRNREYGDLVPWSYIEAMKLKRYPGCYVYYVVVKLRKPLKMKFMFTHQIESELELNILAHSPSAQYLYDELSLFKQKAETSVQDG
jgi:hypothetical protein